MLIRREYLCDSNVTGAIQIERCENTLAHSSRAAERYRARVRLAGQQRP